MLRTSSPLCALLLGLTATLACHGASAQDADPPPPAAAPGAGITQAQLDDAKSHSHISDLRGAHSPDDLDSHQAAEIYTYLYNEALAPFGGGKAMNKVGNIYAAAALADMLVQEGRADGAKTLQQAINHVLAEHVEPLIPETGQLDQKTFAAYCQLAQNGMMRNDLIDSLADERTYWAAASFGEGNYDAARIERFRFTDVRGATQTASPLPTPGQQIGRALPDQVGRALPDRTSAASPSQ